MQSLRIQIFCGVLLCCVCCFFAGDVYAEEKIVLGFVQVSPEGTWRMTNTKSIQTAAEEAGIHLIHRVGTNNYTNQITEMYELMDMGVDVLAFSPSQVDGWEDILAEAELVGVPVIVLDRAITTSDPSLYVTHIGSDMIEEGRRAARWLIQYVEEKGLAQDEFRIVVLEGVQGSTPAVHRDQGFREVLADYPEYVIQQSRPADYIFSKGEEVMSAFLLEESGNIDVVFAHNDEMALGAIEAIKKYGKKPGEDIIVIGVDAIKKAFEAMMAGELNASIECSPLLGPQLMDAVKDVVAGRTVPHRIVTDESVFDQGNAEDAYLTRTY